jgi:hypothetical protein
MSKIALICALALSLTGCLGAGKWTGRHYDTSLANFVKRHTGQAESPQTIDVAAGATDQGLPDIPLRKKARFCCAFGTDLKVKFGKMPVPWVKVGRMLSLAELGPHRYDGATAAIDDARRDAFPRGEFNGLMYTCRGGFIDTAHVRETVDWAAFFVAKLDQHLESGAVLDLGREGGERRMILRPIAPELIERYGRQEVLRALGQWMSHQVMAWHEFAQWYGWSVVALYPEVVSGFSPEDVYSNAIGARLLDDVDLEAALSSEKIYNRTIDELIHKELTALGPVDKEVASDAVKAVDQVWWDSQERLPDPALVLRRYLDADTELEPWLLPEKYASPKLKADLAKQCGENPRPRVIHIPDSIDGVRFDEIATMEIVVEGRIAPHPIFQKLGRRITHHDFPVLLEDIRAQNHAEFGVRADLPD